MVSQRLRRYGFLLPLAAARFRTRPGRTALVAVGTAVGTALLAAVLAGSLAAQDRSLARALSRIAPIDRAVRAVWGGIPAQGSTRFGALDRTARTALGHVARERPFAAAVFAETEVGAATVNLGAIDGLTRWVRLRSGRFPHSCSPRRCEVVRVAGRGAPTGAAGLRLAVVGVGKLRSELALGGLVSQTTNRSKTPFLLASAVRPLADNPLLAYDSRTYEWALPLSQAGVHPWTVRPLVRSIVSAGSALAARDSSFEISAPQDELLTAADTARVAGRRLLLLGGEAAALLLAFTVLAAARLRRGAGETARRLTWFGATRVQILVAALLESLAVGLVGAFGGWAAGTGLGALLARSLGTPAGEAVRHSVLGETGIAVAVAAAAVAALVLWATLQARAVRLGRLSVSPIDVAALAALVVVALALARGATDASQRGTGLLLLVLPGLIVFAGAVLAARILVPALRLLERAGRRGPLALRLAALSLARNPGQAVVTAAFLVVSLGLAVFAATYRSTLVTGQRDEAAFTVPREELLSEDLTRLVSVVDAGPLSAYRRLGDAAPAIRLAGDVPDATTSSGLTVLGLPHSAIPRIDGWRSDFSRLPLAELARRVSSRAATGLDGTRLPPRSRVFALPVTARGDDLALTVVLETRRGNFTTIRLGDAPPGRRVVLRAPIPREARGGTLVAIDPELPNTGLHDQSVGPGTEVAVVARGTASLGQPRADGRPLGVDYARWVGLNGIAAAHAGPGGSVVIRFVLTPDRDPSFRPSVSTDRVPVRVVASPAVAAAAGPGRLVALDTGGQILRVRVVATATRFPSIDGDFVVADRATLATAMNAGAPGTAVTNEVWLDARPGESVRTLEASLARPPFAALARSSRRALESELAAEPLARGSLLVLEGGAAAALALALAGILLGVLTDLGDERGELLDLESQGAAPAALRRQVRLRSVFVALFGLVGGLAVGAALSGLVVRLVTLTANPGETATVGGLPLRLDLDWRLVALAAAVLAVVASALVSLPTRRAFR